MKIKKMDLDPPRVPVGSPEIPPYAKAPSRLLTLGRRKKESYTQRHAPLHARLLKSRRSAQFLLALGLNAAIPARSRVQCRHSCSL